MQLTSTSVSHASDEEACDQLASVMRMQSRATLYCPATTQYEQNYMHRTDPCKKKKQKPSETFALLHISSVLKSQKGSPQTSLNDLERSKNHFWWTSSATKSCAQAVFAPRFDLPLDELVCFIPALRLKDGSSGVDKSLASLQPCKSNDELPLLRCATKRPPTPS